ncbi:MAG: hypothetical protein ACI4XD_01585 [Clostridia bacterium]
MYKIIKFIENVIKFLKIKTKIIYWKIKYGKRIKIGKNFKFRKGLVINISKNGYLEIGDNNAFNNYCSINCHKMIKIGKNNMFGENVKLYDHNHVFNDKSKEMRYAYSEHEIIIGDNNWIASDVMFLSKGSIKNNNVVGAKVIVNREYNNENVIKLKNECIVDKISYIGE